MSYRITNNTNEISVVRRRVPKRGERLFNTYDEAWTAIYKRSMARYEAALLELQLVTDELEAVAEMEEA
jgi:hypothetical protein